jgi:CubicO group peptidase (beta-lactamase class C family)
MKSTSITSKMQSLCEKSDFTGIVQLSREESVLFEMARGWANRSDRIPNELSTRFAIASGSKGFTAVAVLQLIESGLISLDNRLHDCLDVAFPNSDPGITVRHLLSHTSGMPYYFDEEANPDYEAVWQDTPMYRVKRPSDFLPLFQHLPQDFPPGERFAYNDAGFIVLGLIIEQHSGMTFIDYVTEHVLRRAGMFDSGYFSSDCLPERVATGYIDSEDANWRTNTFAVPIVGAPDGGAYVTARDIAAFWQALRSGRLLNEEWTREMMRPQVKAEAEGPNCYYGLGIWSTKKDDDLRSYYLTGWDPGAAFMSEYFVESDLLLTFISNSNLGFDKTYKKLAGTISPG